MQAQIRLGWGRRGASEAATRGDILVVVDTLRFSSAASIAVSLGHTVLPVCTDEEAARLGEALGPEALVGRRYLSPHELFALPGPRSLVLATPNGATCCTLGAGAPRVLVGALLNARAAASAAAHELARGTAPAVTVLACGEIHEDDGTLRVALEDALGAGAILARLPETLTRTAEARAAEATFLALQDQLESLLLSCETGQELEGKGKGRDIAEVARLDSVSVVPVLEGGRLMPWVSGSDP